ncbi:hypothetical protein CCMA1212_001649 [Trichoderma ghanense]|uniref:Uncharacterized protein n=1 Tax=Trichoderma ghanense TaxID=65468 RepID=A0ABY2HDC6_9HYPO
MTGQASSLAPVVREVSGASRVVCEPGLFAPGGANLERGPNLEEACKGSLASEGQHQLPILVDPICRGRGGGTYLVPG